MKLSKLIGGSALAAAMAVSGLANAAILVEMNPFNEGLTPTEAPYGPFTASGAIGGLASTLEMNNYGVAGLQGYTESGRIVISNFTGGTSANVIGPNLAALTYGIYADFSLTGQGLWNLAPSLLDCKNVNPCSTFSAVTANFSATVYGVAQGGTIGTSTITLGTLTVRPGTALSATAILDLDDGSADTSLTAIFDFLPAAGTTGAGNFFVDYPGIPMSFIFSGSNIGGNFLNTSLEPFPNPLIGDEVVISTPGNQANLGRYPGSFNVTFDQQVVPEPGSIALAGLALAALGAISRRNGRSKS